MKRYAHNIYDNLKVYHFDIYLPGHNEPVDTKICCSSVLRARNAGRSLKKEHGATKVRIECNESFKSYVV